MATYSIRTEISIFACSIVLLGCGALGLATLDQKFFDLDGDPLTTYPVHGQDSPRFVSLAESIYRGEGFVGEGGMPETFRTPGYPSFLALGLYLGGGFALPLMLQILMAGGILLLTFLMGKYFGGVWMGGVALGLMFFSPNFLFHSLVLLSDIPMTFLVLLALYWLLFLPLTASRVAGAGVLLGFAALIRPVALYLPILLLPFLLYRLYTSAQKKKLLEVTLGFLACVILVVYPWFVRNSVETGTFGFSSVSVYNLAGYNIPQFLEKTYGRDSEEFISYTSALYAIPSPVAHSFSGVPLITPLIDSVLETHLFAYARFHSIETAKFFLSSNVRAIALTVDAPLLHRALGLTEDAPNLLTLLREGAWAEVGETLKSQIVITIDRLLLLILTVAAFCSVVIARYRTITLALLLVILYFAFLTGPVSIPRYRLPVDPYLLVLALVSLGALLRHLFSSTQEKIGGV